ncbi:P-loop containing nucleoside triphosphate hydrolase protein, partial [Lasiosphaeris hirsuta]
MMCNGWTMMLEPDGCDLIGSDGKPDLGLELFEGEVIIDVKEAYDQNPQWRIQDPGCQPYGPETLEQLDAFSVVLWSDEECSRAEKQNLELVVLNDDVQRYEFNRYMQSDAYLRGKTGAIPPDKDRLSQDDLALLPRRLYVFSLCKRFFGPMDVSYLRPICPQTDAFEKLQIDDDKKSRIESMIDYHFLQKAARSVNRDIATQDFMRRGGCGLVILIQGAPGVGKTATASAVAQAYQKPLFSIQFGDLDFRARKLAAFFRWAERWDCIVLMDEIDVFLTQRDRYTGLDSNIFVSLLLRVLDEFSGILFLTSNRPGVLDEALSSRVHLNLCYPKLSLEHTRGVFQLNIDSLEESQRQQHSATGQPPLCIFAKDILAFAERHYAACEPHDGV